MSKADIVVLCKRDVTVFKNQIVDICLPLSFVIYCAAVAVYVILANNQDCV